MEYRYHLLKYNGRDSRLTCPGCGRRHCFTPYVDADDVPANPERYGVCDHKSSCGYSQYPPSEPLASPLLGASKKGRKKPVFGAKRPSAAPCLIPDDIIRKTLVFTAKNTLFSFLCSRLGEDAVRQVFERYCIGTTRDGSAVFYQIDMQGHCRSGKIIPYDPQTGHRIKDGSRPPVMWVHSKLKSMGKLDPNWVLTQCLFGEHLLAENSSATVGLVEAEKTAVICAALLPEYLWLATGGLDQWGEKLMVLKGRKVVAFPDSDGYATWLRKAAEFRSLDITVSDLLERTCTLGQRALKVDIADLLLEDFEK